jgi:hypothetical protein
MVEEAAGIQLNYTLGEYDLTGIYRKNSKWYRRSTVLTKLCSRPSAVKNNRWGERKRNKNLTKSTSLAGKNQLSKLYPNLMT